MKLVSDVDQQHMRRACELAYRGQGHVEPNPMVGCVIACGEQIVAEGWHRRFGGPHAEIEALTALEAAGSFDRSTLTMYVTLEPCCHQGKTPPCTAAVIGSGIPRVVLAMLDPYPRVAGAGVQQLRAAGIDVKIRVGETSAARVLDPFVKVQLQQRPWMIAKWAMSLDGKIATTTGDSQWISNSASRQITHQIRGRVDAIAVGIGTALADDPLLTARPSGPRTATRVVFDSQARLPLQSQLVQTAAQVPVQLVVSEGADAQQIAALRQAQVEVLMIPETDRTQRLDAWMRSAAQQGWTNVLVEGGSQLLGSLLEMQQIDEVHVFAAPLLIGGQDAPSPLGGGGMHALSNALRLHDVQHERIEDDIYIHGRIAR